MRKKVQLLIFFTVILMLSLPSVSVFSKQAFDNQIMSNQNLFSGCFFQFDDDLSDFFSEPKRNKNLVFVIFSIELENQVDDVWARAILKGFEITYFEAHEGDILGVIIDFITTERRIYFVEWDVYHAYLNDDMMLDEFIDNIEMEILSK